MEEENEETDAYSEDQDQIEDDMPASNFMNASRTQNQWKFHNNSLTKRGILDEENGAIEECANEEDILSNSNKENAAAQQSQQKQKSKKKPIQNQTMTSGFGLEKSRDVKSR
jgi:hypothetical protein